MSLGIEKTNNFTNLLQTKYTYFVRLYLKKKKNTKHIEYKIFILHRKYKNQLLKKLGYNYNIYILFKFNANFDFGALASFYIIIYKYITSKTHDL